MSDKYHVPDNYAQVFKSYFEFVCSLVIKYGIEEQSAEDVASSILLKFIERDSLTHFDPTMEFTHGAKTYKARFKTYLASFVRIYVQHYRTKQGKVYRREPLTCDAPTADGSAWIDVFGPTCDGGLDEAERTLMVTSVLESARLRLSDDPDMATFFEAVQGQVISLGTFRIARLQKELGVSRAVVKSRLDQMRSALAEAMSEADLTLDSFA